MKVHFAASREVELRERRSLSTRMQQSFRDEVNHRRMEAEFNVRGLAARDQAKRTGGYCSKNESRAVLDSILVRHMPGTRQVVTGAPGRNHGRFGCCIGCRNGCRSVDAPNLSESPIGHRPHPHVSTSRYDRFSFQVGRCSSWSWSRSARRCRAEAGPRGRRPTAPIGRTVPTLCRSHWTGRARFFRMFDARQRSP